MVALQVEYGLKIRNVKLCLCNSFCGIFGVQYKKREMVKFYKFCFWAYMVSLLVLVYFNFFGDAAAGYAGDSVGLDPMAYVFLAVAVPTIALSLIITYAPLSLRVKHNIHYIISVLIFIIVCFDAWWLYNEIADQDYSLFFGFFIFFVFVSALSFYALVKKII